MKFEPVKWIGAPEKGGAPWFRREFEISVAEHAELAICGLGWYEVYLNGRKVGDHVLDPIVTNYDLRARYVVYDVTEYLKPGRNTVGVVLGNGWYDHVDADVWNFDHAPWRDRCKFALHLRCGGVEVVSSDPAGWRCTTSGPITFNSLRNGEFYDARLELPGWAENGFDDSAWTFPVLLAPPGGVLEEQTTPPCKVMRRIRPVSLRRLSPTRVVADFGVNLSGWCRIRVRGRAGEQLELRYGERLFPDGSVDKEHIGIFVKSGENQCDHYILRGGSDWEEWAPRFTFHGFQFCQIDGTAELGEVTAEFVHTSFPEAGNFDTSDADLNALQKAVRESYRGNFVGIPFDGPHREKNGWTGDAQLAAEAGLCNFGVASSLEQWLDTLADNQRPSGQLPGIAPACGWGYNWGAGPAWDAAFFVIPELIYLYTGSFRTYEKHFGRMLRYLEYADSLATGGLVSFGLGDWNHVDNTKIAPVEFTSSAYILHCNDLAAKFARRLGRTEDAARLSARADAMRAALNAKYGNGNGSFAHDEMTALGLALEFNIAPEEERSATAARLDRIVRENGYRPYFGILGSRAVPRALAEAGYVETAFRLIVQPEFPGWVNWLRQGATTLWGNWDGGASRNHIMFGDVSAWCFRYLGGLVPDESHPGFSAVTLRPRPVSQLSFFRMFHETPHGRIELEWRRNGGKLEIRTSVPDGVPYQLLEPSE